VTPLLLEILEGLVYAIIAAGLLALLGRILFMRWGIAAGRWQSTFTEDQTKYTEDIACCQFGSRILGFITVQIEIGGSKSKAKFRFRGVSRHGVIAAYYRGGIANASRGTFLMRYSPATDRWTGVYVFFNSEDRVVSIDYGWNRPS
jgi:hypothetical protein